VLDTIEKDVQFLSQNNLMDYSILIGIEEIVKYANFGIGLLGHDQTKVKQPEQN